jgi:hypothetical protein
VSTSEKPPEDDFVSSWRDSIVGGRASIGVPVRGLSGIATIVGSLAVVAAAVIGTVLAVQAVTRPDGPAPQQNASLAAVEMDTGTPSATLTTPVVTTTPKAGKTRHPVTIHRTGVPTVVPKTKTSTSTVTHAATKTRTAAPVVADPSVDLASAKPVTADNHAQDYVVGNVTDGDVSTYWEADPGFPQAVTVDLGSVQTVGRLELALPPVSDWNSRTQTIAVGGSRNGSSFKVLKAAAGYLFDANAASGDRVSVELSPVRTRYLRLTFTANSGWSSAQLSELEVHSS